MIPRHITLHHSIVALLDFFQKQDVAARVVGGYVRDALLGVTSEDVDIGVACSPLKTMEILSPHGHVIPTGLQHGTITFVGSNVTAQITSLRRDVDTHGRHAHVAFGVSFHEDALRRDFTINALSVDASGILHDMVRGVRDVIKRQVRFIGEPDQRVQEDYLRILRFFRMHLLYGVGRRFHTKSLNACIRFKDHLAHLSNERIRQEIFKIFTSSVPTHLQNRPDTWIKHRRRVVRMMCKKGILRALDASIVQPISYTHWRCFDALWQKYRDVCQSALYPVLSLLSLGALSQNAIRYALTRSEKKEIAQLQTWIKTLPDSVSHGFDLSRMRHLLYTQGRDRATAWILYAGAFFNQDITYVIEMIQTSHVVPCPVTSLDIQDLLKDKAHTGADIGHLIRLAEWMWCQQNFQGDKVALIHSIKATLVELTPSKMITFLG